MALIKCPECSSEVSSAASACPKCGHPILGGRSSAAGIITAAPGTVAPPGATKYANRTVFAVFAILLGGIGIHRFYVGQTGKGLLYLVFCWTFIPAIIGLFEGLFALAKDDTGFGRTYNVIPT
jgi:TM2 domain-containing membrane protein YozV